MHRSKIACLFDHLIGTRQQRRRHIQAECFGSFQVNDEFKLDKWVCIYLASSLHEVPKLL